MRKKYLPEMVEKNQKTYYIIRDQDNYTLAELPSRYLVHLIQTNKSPNSVKQAAFGISYYLNYLNTMEMEPGDVVRLPFAEQNEHFQHFLKWLQKGMHTESGRKTSNVTCNIYLRTVIAWYGFLTLEYRQKELQITETNVRMVSSSVGVGLQITGRGYRGYLREQEPDVKAIRKEDIRLLVSAATNIRDRLFILMAADTGARIGELLGIRYTTDIDYDKKQIRIFFRDGNANQARAKNEENRTLLLSDDTYSVLQIYLATYCECLKNTDYLFVVIEGETKGKPMDSGAVYAMFRRLQAKTGIHTTAHQFRRYFANERRKAGWNIEEIACAMGHRNISTTMRYFLIGEDEREKASKEYFAATEELYDINALL